MARRARWLDRAARGAAAAGLCACATLAHAQVDARAARIADFDRFCAFVADGYAYFDRKRTDWPATCDAARGEAADAIDRAAFIGVVERTLDALYDFHAHLGTSTKDSRRLVPTNADLHASWRDGRAFIVDVRAASAAREAGLREGMQVVAVDGRPVAEAVAARLPTHLKSSAPQAPESDARDWALDAVLAGRQDAQAVRVDVVDRGRAFSTAFVPHRARGDGPLAAHCEGQVGVIAFNNSLGDVATIAAYDDALASLPCRRALVVDLRDTPSGGTSTVARGVIGRLIAAEAPYQRHELPSEMRETGVRRVWVEYVEPRDPVPVRAVVVLVGHWTGSIGEGLAIGLNAARGAPVIGRPMAGLLGALDELRLPNADFVVRVPTERLSHVDGTPREAFVPCAIPGDPPDEDAQLAYAVRLALTIPSTRAARSAGSCPRPARR